MCGWPLAVEGGPSLETLPRPASPLFETSIGPNARCWNLHCSPKVRFRALKHKLEIPCGRPGSLTNTSVVFRLASEIVPCGGVGPFPGTLLLKNWPRVEGFDEKSLSSFLKRPICLCLGQAAVL